MKWIQRGEYDPKTKEITPAILTDMFVTIDPITGVNYLHYGNTIIPRLDPEGRPFITAPIDDTYAYDEIDIEEGLVE